MGKVKHVCVGNLLRSRLQCVENCYISHFSSCEKLGKYQFGKNADKKVSTWMYQLSARQGIQIKM